MRRALGASYRHVWGALKQWEALGELLVTWAQGQPARLTPFADRLLWAERQACTRLTPDIGRCAPNSAVLADAFDGTQQVLTIHASHDLALARLRELASQDERLHIELKFSGPGRCARWPRDAARSPVSCARARSGGAAVLAGAQAAALPGRHKLIGCTRRMQGLMVAPASPRGVRELSDLAGRDLRCGTASRDRRPGCWPTTCWSAPGWMRPRSPAGTRGAEDSHLAVAAAGGLGPGDAGLGIGRCGADLGLDFVPLVEGDLFSGRPEGRR